MRQAPIILSAIILLSLSMITLAILPAHAIVVDNSQTSENVQVIVTTDRITIETNFSGTQLYIAGVLENADPQVLRQNRYDIIIVIEGPARQFVMRKKQRKAGMWVNADSMTFYNVPTFYTLASTRQLRDITLDETYKNLGLGLAHLPLRSDATNAEKNRIFKDELIKLKKDQHLYQEAVGSITFGSSSLFTSRFQLPANIPVGRYQVHAFLFKDRHFIATSTTQLSIEKSHLAYSIFRSAHVHSIWYGLAAVLVAIATGFAGRFIFRKD